MSPISVIIVNFNSGSVLLETVSRVLQSSIPVEVYISDNGSLDDSVKLIKTNFSALPNVHIIENEVNLGFSKGNNVVLPLCLTEYFLFLNPDCLIEPTTIEDMLSVMVFQPDVGMASCLILNEDGTEQTGCRRLIPKPKQALLQCVKLIPFISNLVALPDFNLSGTPLPDHPIHVEAISGAFMLVKRSALECVGPLDPGYFLHCEDLDWCFRFTKAGFNILFVPNVIITHIKGSCSISRPIFVEWHKHKGMLRFYRKFYINQYPRPLMWLVTLGVLLRFGVLATTYSCRHFIKLLGATRG